VKVGVVDYGLGNLRSVAGAIERVGHEPVVASDPDALEQTERLVLPGVGAFGDGMRNLHMRGLVEPLSRFVLDEGRPVLGICLGAQLLATESDEFGAHQGLGWIEGTVRRIVPPNPSLRVPHVGWNSIRKVRDSVLLDGLPDEPLFYFVHSYHVICADESSVIADCEYGVAMTAVFQRANVHGVQFHPEKSQLAGLTLLQNFLTHA
jgi:glutamine amidotransferase